MATVSIRLPFGKFVVSITHAIRWSLGKGRRLFGGWKPPKRIQIYTHHKIATALTSKIFREISLYYGLSFSDAPGFHGGVDSSHIVHYWHSQVSTEILDSTHLGVHFIRDPRDVIVSGYLFHKRTDEAWCINKNLNVSGEINHPQVDFSQVHLTHEEKSKYLEWLDGKSYQENIASISQDDGLIFEMNGFAGRTIDCMTNWTGNEQIIEVKFEEITTQYDKMWKGIFTHLGFTDKAMEKAMSIARKHDIGRMSGDEIKQNKHISTGKISKWKDFFSEAVEKEYSEKFNDAHQKLGYE